MTEPIQLMLEATIKQGREEAFGNARRTIPDAVRSSEPDTLDFRWVRQEAGDRVWFLDLYASSDALVEHFQNLRSSGNLDALMAACDITAVHCIGTPDAAARGILDPLGVVYFSQVAGFSRLPPLATATAAP